MVPMCLLKVYLDEGESGKKLIADEVALISREGDHITLKNLEFEETSLRNVEIISINTLNSILILKRRKG